MKVLIYLLSGISVAGLCYFLAAYFDIRAAHNRLGLSGSVKIPHSLIINIFMPVIKRLAGHLKGLRLIRIRGHVKKSLQQAGLGRLLTVEEFWAFQIIIFFILVFMTVLFPIRFLWPVLGILFPIQWLHQLVKNRRDEIVRTMPDIVDILMLSVEAGLDLMSAIGRVVGASGKGALADELKIMLDETMIGATRSEALRHLSSRCDIPAVTSFVSLLVQADRLGSSIGPILKAHSEMMRSDRFQRAERAGHIAAQKILFPLVFFIMPAVFIIIFGPIVIRFMSGGLFTP